MNRKTKIVKQAIKEALLEMLEEKPLESISVRSLCQLADINRSTFYAHYEDLNALVAEMEEEILSHVVFFDGYRSVEDQLDLIEDYVHYIKENQRLFLLFLKNGRLYSAFLSRATEMNYHGTNPHHYAMLVSYAVLGSLSALTYWLENPGSRTEQGMAQMDIM